MRLFGPSIMVLMLIWISACTSTNKSLREHKGSYLESVKLNYEAGLEALAKEEFDKAIAYFQFVRSKYPFSQYASLSDLKIADTKFAQKKWLAAASAYEVFIRLHPRHEDVSYASYRLGASYFYAVPDDFFLLPSPTSRDQTYTKEAIAAIERFMLQFPESEYVADSREKLATLYTNLAKHNQLIAQYYESRGRFEAAVSRYLSVDDLYPETPQAAESLFLAAMIIKNNIKDEVRASELLQRLVENKPGSMWAKKAAELLQKAAKKTQNTENAE